MDDDLRTAARGLVVAIDGPAGSGKSTVAAAVAARLGLRHLDTGAIYRAITLACRRAGVDPADGVACAALAGAVRITQADRRTSLDGEDVEDEIRGPAVTAAVSQVSAHAEVRAALLGHQRALAADGAVVEGRDIGTVVLPDADLKVFLTAEPGERARRRAAQSGADPAAVEAEQRARDDADAGREVAPLRAADDAWTLDTTGMTLEEVVDAVEGRVLGIAADRLGDGVAVGPRRLPRVVIVGRPNVGKSTFVNRVLRERVTIVEAVPGVTRDRTEHEAEHRGVAFVLVDTGGWERRPEEEVTGSAVAQTEAAIAGADLAVQLVDGATGVLDDDEAVARLLRRRGVPTLLAVNKVDREADVAAAQSFVRLGLGEPHAVSARNGRGIDELLDAVVAGLSGLEGPGSAVVAAPDTPRVAIVGKPNVGKSSLLNRLVGEERAVVAATPHTTRDAIDTRVELDGREWVLVDTAGLRRRYRSGEDLEQYAVDRTRAAVERADVALFVVDAGEPIGAQDQRLAALLRDAGCALVVVINKWDLVDEDRRLELERELDRLLSFAAWAPRVNVSAATGRGVSRLAPALVRVLANHRRRIPTSVLNQLVARAVEEHAPARAAQRPVRVRYAVQVAVSPPTVLLFANGPVDESWRRFLERRLREDHDFEGTPVIVEDRGRGGAPGAGEERGRPGPRRGRGGRRSR
ncbi:MAG: ribosome biogenesis GTPase Der [Nitriliruptoraceae bacterium]